MNKIIFPITNDVTNHSRNINHYDSEIMALLILIKRYRNNK